MSTDKTTPEQTEQPTAAEPVEATPAGVEASAETATTPRPAIVSFLRDNWLTALLAVLLAGAIVYGAVFTASSSRWEASSGDFEAQLAETTAAKAEVEAAKAEVEAAKIAVEATNTDLQGDLDECRSTADAADVLVGLDKQAGDKLSAFMDTFFSLMATTSDAEAQSLLGTIETQGAEIEALDGQVDAAEKTYDERVGLCRD
ncbi:hypothetical protein L1785_15405 [Antribacter sp. KLBMP9083]|uniref:Uncharacterized protein n=1 Tax=Antribacter soli TaxID=2910976 RepID=A0AA41QF89_9MICO|nr:hypothetical protein [Antribacter soli]MCF4122365.1 hypothetical protein [Antribacter soli]